MHTNIRRVFVHSHVEREDGRKECFATEPVRFGFSPKGKLRVYWCKRWRTVRNARQYPGRQLLIRDTLTRTRVQIVLKGEALE